MVRVFHIVPMSLFFSAYTNYKREGENLSTPTIIPWKAWGPTHSRMFLDDFTIPTAAHGSNVMLNGDTLLDFNVLDVRRATSLAEAAHYRTDVARVSTNGPRQRIGRYVNHVASKVGSSSYSKVDDAEIPFSTGQVVRHPTTIPHKDIFVEDVVTNLPYQETTMDWPSSADLPAQLYGGDVWIARRSGEVCRERIVVHV